MARYIIMIGIKRMTRRLIEKLTKRIVCILEYFSVSFMFLNDKSQLLRTASYTHFPSIVIIYLVYTFSAFTILMTPNRRINKKIVKLPCRPPDTTILSKANRYTVGDITKEAIPYSNIGKKFSLHFLSAVLMLLFLSLR